MVVLSEAGGSWVEGKLARGGGSDDGQVCLD